LNQTNSFLAKLRNPGTPVAPTAPAPLPHTGVITGAPAPLPHTGMITGAPAAPHPSIEAPPGTVVPSWLTSQQPYTGHVPTAPVHPTASAPPPQFATHAEAAAYYAAHGAALSAPLAALVNPPESALPPAPPVGAAAPAEAPRRGRGRPAKVVTEATAPETGTEEAGGLSLEEAFNLADHMKKAGIRKFAFSGDRVCVIEVA
jgi:hypothetical protein